MQQSNLGKILFHLSVQLCFCLGLHAQTLVGLWEFDNAVNPAEPTIGSPLIVNGSPSSRQGIDATDGAFELGVGESFTCDPGISANGGGNFVNEYTLVYDVYLPASTNNTWRSLLQTSSSPTGNDGDYFVSSSNTVGLAAIGYSPQTLLADDWYRIIFSADLGSSVSFVTTVIDSSGNTWQYDHASQNVDGRHAIFPNVVHFFADENGEDNLLYVTQLALLDGPLDKPTALGLGGPGTTLQQINSAPVIAGNETITLDATLNGPAVSIDLDAVDSNGDPLTWSLVETAVPGSSAIVSQSSTQATIAYTPAPGYIGTDQFSIEVSDGELSDQVEINVNVTSPLAGAGQFYFEDFDSATLQAEITTGGERRMNAGDNTPVWNTPAGSNLGLSSGPDSFLNDPGDRIVEFQGFNLARTDFWRNDDNQNRSVAFPPGNNVIAVADSDEFSDGGGAGAEDEFNVFLRTPSIAIPADAAVEQMQLRFLSSFRAEENETSRVFIYHNGSSSPSATLVIPDNGAQPASQLAFGWNELGSPAPGSTMQLEFAHEDADNNWWWAIDEVFVGIPNQAPEIAEGASLNLATGKGGSFTRTIAASDAQMDSVNWSFSLPPANGQVEIVSSGSTDLTFRYTPAPGFLGSDSFIIRAADNDSFNEITINVEVVNSPPNITEGESFTLNVAQNTARDLTLNVTDPDGDPQTWSLSGGASNGNVTIISQSNSAATFRYDPATDFTGIDTFTVEVSDGIATDSIVVNVSVSNPSADPELTIVAPFGLATPSPGVYSHPRGTELTNTVSGQTVGSTRYTPVGWTMLGNGPNNGTGNTMEMTLTRDSVLTWEFLTEYLIDTEVSGNGSVDVPDGWYSSEKPLAITATPAPGYYFAGWSGDTSGALTGGKTIVLPMDREYGTITANFELEQAFTVIGLPDTQNYSSQSSPTDVFESQTQWVIDNLTPRNIKFVTHHGDIVNSPWSSSQWNRATEAMDLLYNQVPHGTVPGNHDIASGNTQYLGWFGPDGVLNDGSTPRWIDPDTGEVFDWYRGSSPSGYSDYQIINVDGRDWMFLHLEIDARDADIAWAQSVLDAHPTTLTVLTTHNYLAETGGGGAAGSGTGERGRVPVQWISGADRNAPEQIFQKLIYPNNQIFMVLCGHNFAIYNLEETNIRGNVVHEVLVDYQTLPNGGNGFLRIMEFEPSAGTIEHSTYSPFLGRFYDPENSADHQGMFDLHDRQGSAFTLNVDFEGRFDSQLTVASPQTTVEPGVGTHNYADGTPIVLSASPVVTGNSRELPVAWSITGNSPSSGSGDTATVVMDGDATVDWQWQTQHYLETQATGDGIVSVVSGWIDDGRAVELIAQPDAGASFIGWSGDLTGATIDNERLSFAMDRPRGPVIANFSGGATTHTVEVVSDQNTASPTSGLYTYEQGSEVTFSASERVVGNTRYIPTGYSLSGGLTGSGSETSVTLTVTADFVLTWNWQTQHRLLTEVTGPGFLSQENPWIPEGDPFTLVATPAVESSFTGWGGSTAGGTLANNEFTVASMTAPLGPVSAEFQRNQYKLTVVSPHGTSAFSPGEYDLDWGSDLEITMNDESQGRTRRRVTGWQLEGSTTTSGSGATTSFTLTEDATLTWNFATEHLLEITSGQEGVVGPLGASGWYAEGQSVTLTAAPEPHFVFKGWLGDTQGDATLQTLNLTMDQPRTVAPDFEAQMTANGTPLWWLEENTQVIGGDYATAETSDHDGDGVIARDEFLAGTSDNNPISRFRSLIEANEDGSSTLRWWANHHRNYEILGYDTLTDAPVSLGFFDGNGRMAAAEMAAGGAPQYFYRIAASLKEGNPLALDDDSPAASHAPKDGALTREMVLIPGGSYTRGEDGSGIVDTRPAHPVTLQPFYMDVYEVTREDWQTVVSWAQSRGYDLPMEVKVIDAEHVTNPRYPIGPVLWYDAVKWCNARSEMEGLEPVYFADTAGTTVYRTGQINLTKEHVNWAGNGYRLPTDAEWEFAARGGLAGENFYPWGPEDTISRAPTWDFLVSLNQEDGAYPLWYEVGSMDGTQQVPEGYTAEDMANGYGLYDMAGNAYEWVWDRYSRYEGLHEYDPKGPDTGDNRIRRGGSWYSFQDDARCSRRPGFPPGGDDNFGENSFRCIRSAHPSE